MQITDAVDHYQSFFLAQRYSLKTWTYYEWEMHEFKRWLGDRGISDIELIKVGDLYDYGAYVRQRGFLYPRKPNARVRPERASRKTNETVMEGTMLRSLIVIRSFYSFLERAYKMENIARVAFPDIRPHQTRETQYLEPAVLAPLVAACGSAMEIAIIHVLLATGVRQGELRGCKTADYLRDKKALRVIGKGGAQRTVDLTNTCVEAIEHWLRRLHRPKTEYLFCRRDGSPLESGDIIYMFRKISAKVGFRVTAHMMRHTMATYLAKDGVSTIYIQAKLGHKRAETTGRYVHMTPEMTERHKAVIERYEPKLVPEGIQPVRSALKKKKRHVAEIGRDEE